MSAISENPLLKSNGLPLFSQIKPEQVRQAVEFVIDDCKKTIVATVEKFEEHPDFDSVMTPIFEADDRFSRVWSVVSHLNSVNNTDSLRKAHDECLPLIADYSSWAGQYKPLYEIVKKILGSPAFGDLPFAKQKTVENMIRDFRLTGVDLDKRQQQEFAAISSRLSQLQSAFANNVLDATHGYFLHTENEKDLSGLPDGSKRLAASEAKARGLKGYVFTLEMPSYLPFLTYADNRELRRQLYEAYNTRSSEIGPNGGKWDNAPLMEEILRLRHHQANLLGYKSFAHLSLASKMAEDPKQVLSFLYDLADRSKAQGVREFIELENYAKSQGADKLEPWDLAYWSEKLRQERYAYNAEELRSYFPVDKVISGMFKCAGSLYDISFKQRKDVDVWNENVRCYDLYENEFGGKIGTLFMDLYSRAGKQGGAWMDECLTRRLRADGCLQLPVAYLVCNFTRPVGGKSALLTHDETVTLFHEFGHSLNQLLTRIDVADVSGINGVPWDCVELPSQFHENFAWQSEVLSFLSSHVDTLKPLPDDKLQSLINAKNFQSAMAMLRQLEFAIFDFRIHLEYDESKGGRIYEILNEVKNQVAVTPSFKDSRFPNNFTHIFAGGYAAGYYSYKWAEVLAADAFSRFLEEGVLNQNVGKSFEKNILAVGGAADPMRSFVKFRGRKPQVDALLRQSGITD